MERENKFSIGQMKTIQELYRMAESYVATGGRIGRLQDDCSAEEMFIFGMFTSAMAKKFCNCCDE